MAEKTRHGLTDKEVTPANELIEGIVGARYALWKWINEHAGEKYPGMDGSWIWYNDAKQWLYKMVYRKKTVFWASIAGDTFRVTFYFGDNAQPLIEEAPLPPSVKDSFMAAKKIGAIRPVTIELWDQSDADTVMTLVTVKVKLK